MSRLLPLTINVALETLSGLQVGESSNTVTLELPEPGALPAGGGIEVPFTVTYGGRGYRGAARLAVDDLPPGEIVPGTRVTGRSDGEPARARPGDRMAMTRCLNCGRRTQGSRCPSCTRQHDDWQARRKMPSGWKWGEIRARVHERDVACVRCGSHRRLQVHHRVPLRDGGSNELANLELLCSRCHRGS